MMGSFFLCSVVLIILKDNISNLLFENPTYSKYLLAFIITIPFSTFFSIIDSVFKGKKLIGLVTKATIIGTVLSLICNLLLIYFLQLKGAIIGLFIIPIFAALAYTPYLKKNNLRFNFKFSRNLLRTLMAIGLVSVLAGLIQQVTLLVCRIFTIKNFGIEGNGLLQSVVGLSNNYFTFIFITLTAYSFPKIASIKNNDVLVNNEINQNLRFITFIMVPLIIMVFAFKEVLVIILYSKDFSVIVSYLKFQLIGDFFKALGWVFGLWQIPKSRLKLWIGLELLYNVNLIVIFYFLVNFVSSDLVDYSIAYMVAGIIHASLNFWFARKNLGYRISKANNNLLVYSLILLTGSFLYLVYLKNTSSVYLIFFCMIWALVSITKNEKSIILCNVQKFLRKR